jgi:hypothetical protein
MWPLRCSFAARLLLHFPFSRWLCRSRTDVPLLVSYSHPTDPSTAPQWLHCAFKGFPSALSSVSVKSTHGFDRLLGNTAVVFLGSCSYASFSTWTYRATVLVPKRNTDQNRKIDQWRRRESSILLPIIEHIDVHRTESHNAMQTVYTYTSLFDRWWCSLK